MSYGPEKLIPPRDLKECAICSRYFTSDRINVHEAICQKSSMTKRKCFDISKQRLRGTEAERLAETSKSECLASFQANSSCGLSTNWRRKNEELLKKIREAKDKVNENNKKENDLPFPPAVDHNTDYVQCQHCLRKFNQNSALRHISTCANRIKSKTNLTNDQKARFPEF